MSIFEMLVGDLGLSILAWLREHMELTYIALGVYFVIMYTAKFQLRKIESNSVAMIEETIRKLHEEKKSTTPSNVLKIIEPAWKEQSKKWGFFIPGKYSLYPVPFNRNKYYVNFINRDLVKNVSKNMK